MPTCQKRKCVLVVFLSRAVQNNAMWMDPLLIQSLISAFFPSSQRAELCVAVNDLTSETYHCNLGAIYWCKDMQTALMCGVSFSSWLARGQHIIYCSAILLRCHGRKNIFLSTYIVSRPETCGKALRAP